ncbi:hypothetical protein [uncultured Cohaesibacter sp.]|nr:hypothetical protein [uncultured Cohaesibacter sp.]
MLVWISTTFGVKWLQESGLAKGPGKSDPLPKCENWPELLKGLFL